jgi:hypothetical protein
MNKSTTCQTIAFQEVAPHSKEIEKTKNKRLEMLLSNESKLCYDPNEEKTSSIYMILGPLIYKIGQQNSRQG